MKNRFIISHIFLLSVLYLTMIYPNLNAQNQDVSIRFEISVPNAVDSTEVFLSGNHPMLGNWQPDGRQLRRHAGDTVFITSIRIEKGIQLEFKITRGTWQTERLTAEKAVPPNVSLVAQRDTTIKEVILFWKDEGSQPAGSGVIGTIKTFENQHFPGLLPRDVWVWLPPDYKSDSTASYPVLYMHDGQNVFNPATSFSGIDWQVDETAESLIRTGKMQPIIVVAIANSASRTEDYSDTEKGRAYQNFIIEKLKPMIDATFRTKTDAANTAVMGSSMGGLASFLLAWKYPHIVGKAACLSPAFIDTFATAIDTVRETKTPPEIRLYLDNGTEGLEARLQPGCDAMLTALRESGFEDGRNLLWHLEQGAAHNEAAWAERVWRPLLFFFGR